ncbi:MAG TPA: hypothetical protein VNO30_18015 [Kofleriaceae bacterium]|nr:hypothetical protein [Kofleriaceae bacterium]
MRPARRSAWLAPRPAQRSAWLAPRPARRSARLAQRLALAAAGVAAACAGSLDSPGDDGGGGDPDGGIGCSTFLGFEPEAPVASPTAPVRVNAGVVGAPGVLSYTWSVSFGGQTVAHALAQADGSAIAFPATAPGVYSVQLAVGAVVACPTAQAQLNVLAPGARQSQVRLRITPQPGANLSATVPPFERLVTVSGGADFTVGTIALDPGLTATAIVQSGAATVPAYLRFAPVVAREATVEAVASGGSFVARLLNQPHDVLVVPAVPGFAARLVRDWSPGSGTIDLGTGTTVSGVVRDPTGAPLSGAKVQLKVGEVPSTLATTSATGAFSVLVAPAPGAVIAVDVTPPDGSGLPRLLAQSATLLDLAQPFQIDYASSLALRDLGGATVRRGGPAAGAKVIVVGDLAAIGTVTAGGTPAVASGLVRIAATAGGNGALPPTLAPARALTAVIEVAPGDLAVTAIDLTSATPAAIDAPPAVAIATQLRRPDGTSIAEAVLDAIPAGALAQAGVTSAIRARSGTGGQVAASLASGGRYDLRVHDPLLARGAPLVVPDVAVTAVAASYTLRPALLATGKLILQGSPSPVSGAVVQILCASCTGLERSRPLSESTSLPDGRFTLVVPDPGTN